MNRAAGYLFSGFTAFVLFTGAAANNAAAEMTVVPPGNRHAVQPPVPHVSAKRTRALSTTYDAKYRKIHALLQKDARLRMQIAATAKAYGIDPVHIAAAIIGEHTYNVNVYDQLQTYYIKGISWASQDIVFAYRGENISDFVAKNQFAPCAEFLDSYRLWTCREDIWNKNFRGRKVDGYFYPDNRFSAVFFQPFFAGQTFRAGADQPFNGS